MYLFHFSLLDEQNYKTANDVVPRLQYQTWT